VLVTRLARDSTARDSLCALCLHRKPIAFLSLPASAARAAFSVLGPARLQSHPPGAPSDSSCTYTNCKRKWGRPLLLAHMPSLDKQAFALLFRSVLTNTATEATP